MTSQTPITSVVARSAHEIQDIVLGLLAMDEAALISKCTESRSATSGSREILVCRVLLNEYHMLKIKKTLLEAEAVVEEVVDPQPNGHPQHENVRLRMILSYEMQMFMDVILSCGQAWLEELERSLRSNTGNREEIDRAEATFNLRTMEFCEIVEGL